MADNLKILGTEYSNVAGVIVSGYPNYEDYLRIFDRDYSNVSGLVVTTTQLEDRTYLHVEGGSKTSSDLIVSNGTVTVPAGLYAQGAYASFPIYDGTVI